MYDGCNSGLVSGTQVVTVDNNIYDQRSMTQYTYTATGATTWWQIAWPIQIRWKERDLLATATTSTTATSSITPTAGSNATQISSGLSTGAIVGIVLGCLAALAFALGTLCFLCLQRRRQRRLQPQPTVGISAGYGTGPGELPSDPSKQHVFQNSVLQPVFNELDTAPRQYVAEMEGANSLEQTVGKVIPHYSGYRTNWSWSIRIIPTCQNFHTPHICKVATRKRSVGVLSISRGRPGKLILFSAFSSLPHTNVRRFCPSSITYHRQGRKQNLESLSQMRICLLGNPL